LFMQLLWDYPSYDNFITRSSNAKNKCHLKTTYLYRWFLLSCLFQCFYPNRMNLQLFSPEHKPIN
jgi:hypothetical protein